MKMMQMSHAVVAAAGNDAWTRRRRTTNVDVVVVDIVGKRPLPLSSSSPHNACPLGSSVLALLPSVPAASFVVGTALQPFPPEMCYCCCLHCCPLFRLWTNVLPPLLCRHHYHSVATKTDQNQQGT